MATAEKAEEFSLRKVLVVNHSKAAIQARLKMDDFVVDKENEKQIMSVFKRHSGGMVKMEETKESSEDKESDQKVKDYLNGAGFVDVPHERVAMLPVGAAEDAYLSLIIDGKVVYNSILTKAMTFVVDEDERVQPNDSAASQEKILLDSAAGIMSEAALDKLKALMTDFSATYNLVKTAHVTNAKGDRERVINDKTAKLIGGAAMHLRGVCEASSDLVAAVNKHWYRGSLPLVFDFVDDIKKIEDGKCIPEEMRDKLLELFATMGAQALEIGAGFEKVAGWFNGLQDQLNDAMLGIRSDLEAADDKTSRALKQALKELEKVEKEAEEEEAAAKKVTEALKLRSWWVYAIPIYGQVVLLHDACSAVSGLGIVARLNYAHKKVFDAATGTDRSGETRKELGEIITRINAMQEKLRGLKGFCNAMAAYFSKTGQGLQRLGEVYANDANDDSSGANDWRKWDADRIVKWVKEEALGGKFANYGNTIKEGIDTAMEDEDYDKPSDFFNENSIGLKYFGVKSKSDKQELATMLKAKSSEGGAVQISNQLRKMVLSFAKDKAYLEKVCEENEIVQRRLLTVAGLDMFLEKDIEVKNLPVVKIATLTPLRKDPLTFSPTAKVNALLANA